MALTNLDRRASRLEDSLAHLRLQKAKEERDAWRQANSDRLHWEMFLRNHGPESINYIEKDLEDAVESESREEIKAELAYKTLCQKVLSHYKNGWEVDYKRMDETEKALAFLLECFYSYLDRTELFIQDFENWEWKLKLKPELSFVEAIKAIDEHMGSSDWREICYLQEHQDRMMERAFEVEEERRARYLRYKAEHPEEEDETEEGED